MPEGDVTQTTPGESAPESSGTILTDATKPAPETPGTPEAPLGTEVKVETKPVVTETISQADWKKSLGDDFEGLETLDKFKDLKELAKGYVHAEKLIGREKIPMPETDEEIAAVMKRLGAPETVEEYGLELPKETSEQYRAMFQGDLDWFGTSALKHNLTRAQVKGLFEDYVEYQNGNLKLLNEATGKAKNEALVILQKEHGDNLQAVLGNAAHVLNTFGDESLKTTLDETGLGNHTALVRFLNKVHPFIAEEVSLDKAPAQTLAQLDEELNGALNDPAYLDKSKAGHKQAVEKVKKLMKERYPE